MNQNKNSILVLNITLALIIFVALLLRTHHLGEKSIWLDEGLSILIATQKNLNDFYLSLLFNGQQPFYHIVLSGWINLFGKAEVPCRLLSVLFGILAVFSAYKLGALLFNKNVGIVTSILTCLSVFQINSSTEARPYILLSLLSSLSFYFFTKMLRSNNPRNSVWYVVFNTLSLYNHTLGILAIITQTICICFLKLNKKSVYKIKLRDWFIYQFFIFILFLPWLSTLTKQLIHSPIRLSWIANPHLSTVANTFISYFSGQAVLFFLYLAIILYGIFIYKTKKEEIFLTSMFLLGPVIMLFLFSTILFSAYNQNYTIISCIPFYILISFGLECFKKPIKFILLSVIIFFLTLSIKDYFCSSFPFGHRNIQWREASKYIDKTALAKDLVIFYPFFIQGPCFDYYTKRTDIKKFGLGYNLNKKEINKLREIVSIYNNLWIISTQKAPLEKIIIKENYRTFADNSFRGIMIESYTKK